MPATLAELQANMSRAPPGASALGTQPNPTLFQAGSSASTVVGFDGMAAHFSGAAVPSTGEFTLTASLNALLYRRLKMERRRTVCQPIDRTTARHPRQYQGLPYPHLGRSRHHSPPPTRRHLAEPPLAVRH